MSDETSPDEAERIPLFLEVLDRRGLLRALSKAITETADRVTGERFRPREGDKERLAYLRTLAALVVAYNSVLTSTKDHNLEWSKPLPLTERQKARNAAMDASMEDLLDDLAGIKKPGRK